MADEGAQQTGGPTGARRFARFPVSLPVIGRAGQSPKNALEGVVRSVGAGGLMAEFPVQILPGSAVGLVLQTRHGPLTVEGRVVWTSAIGGKVRHGFAFLEPKWPGFAMDLFLDENR
ncbi:MAG: PilZ domain-containing protein [Candidatus Methylomirabilales bacterium]